MQININSSRICCLISLTFIIAVSGCDKEAADSKPDLEKIEKNLKKKAQSSYEAASPEDCPTFTKELQVACTDAVDKRLKFDCPTYLMKLDMAQDQADGKLFDTGSANAKVASALCNGYLKSLHKDVAKAKEVGPEPTAWADSCKDYIATVRKDCLTKIGKGEHAEHCRRTIKMLDLAISQKNDGASACRMGASYFTE